jgi:hypothetical protein
VWILIAEVTLMHQVGPSCIKIIGVVHFQLCAFTSVEHPSPSTIFKCLLQSERSEVMALDVSGWNLRANRGHWGPRLLEYSGTWMVQELAARSSSLTNCFAAVLQSRLWTDMGAGSTNDWYKTHLRILKQAHTGPMDSILSMSVAVHTSEETSSKLNHF